MKKRVVHIVHDLCIGGVEVAVKSSIDYLNENFDFYVLCIGKVDPVFIADVKRKDRIINIPINNIGFPFQVLKIVRFISQLKPTYVLSSLWKSHMISLILLNLKSCDNVIPLFHSAKFRHAVDAYFSRQMIRRSEHILCDSQATRTHIATYTSARVDVLSFITEKIKGTSRNFYTVDTFKIVTVGRLHKIKRQDRIIDICGTLAKEGVKFKLDIFGPDQGEGENLSQLINASQLQDYVRIMGPLRSESVAETLTAYDLFFQMSDAEGMSVSVVQAMMTGLVSIVSNVGEIPNYAQHGRNAFLLEAPFDDNLPQFKQELLRLLDNKEKLNLISQQAVKTFDSYITYTEDINNYLDRL